MRIAIKQRHIPLAATALVLAIVYAAAAMKFPGFFSLRVLVDFFKDNAFVGVAAIGMTFVILSGGIDLSVGAVVGLTSILIATLVRDHSVHPLEAIALALLCGSALGAVMGCLIHFQKLPPFLVTLAGMFFARGLGFLVSGESIGIKHPFYARLMDVGLPLGGAATVPLTALVFLAVFAAGVYLAHFTKFGRTVYAIGGSEPSALLMGLAVGRTKILVYTLNGFCASLAGVVFSFYGQAGNPTWGIGIELDAIAAVVIGGTLLSGGVGYVAGTLMGVLILGVIQTAIAFQGNLNTWWTKIAVGVLLLVFILLQNVVSRVSVRPGGAKRRPAAAGKTPV